MHSEPLKMPSADAEGPKSAKAGGNFLCGIPDGEP